MLPVRKISVPILEWLNFLFSRTRFLDYTRHEKKSKLEFFLFDLARLTLHWGKSMKWKIKKIADEFTNWKLGMNEKFVALEIPDIWYGMLGACVHQHAENATNLRVPSQYKTRITSILLMAM